MSSLPNFNLTSGRPVSDQFLIKKIKTFHDAIRYIHGLPYGRNKNPHHISSIIREGVGTCSTKNSCLKTLAEENEIHSISLNLCIYTMTEKNTPGVGKVLNSYGLSYILEAHTFLSYDNERYDFTFPNNSKKLWEPDILIETTIDPDQILDYKASYHKSILKDWIQRDNIPYTLDKIWDIREACIQALSQNENNQ